MLCNEIVLPMGAGQNFIRSIALEPFNGTMIHNRSFNFSVKYHDTNEYEVPNYHLLNYDNNFELDIFSEQHDKNLLMNMKNFFLYNSVDEMPIKYQIKNNFAAILQQPSIDTVTSLYKFFYDDELFFIKDKKEKLERFKDEITSIVRKFYDTHVSMGCDIIYTCHAPICTLLTDNTLIGNVQTFGLLPRTRETSLYMTSLQDIKHSLSLNSEQKIFLANREYDLYNTFRQYFIDVVYYEDIFERMDEESIRRLFGFFGEKSGLYFDNNKDIIMRKIKNYHENNIKLLTN